MNEWIRFGISAVLTLAGMFMIVSAVFGVFRFRYALNRVHAAALIDTLGILFMIAGLVVARGFQVVSLKMVIVVLFLWLTSPVSSHLIGRLEMTVNDHLDQEMTVQDPVQIEKERES